MTKRGTGDEIPANALRNKKERDRYAVVTSTLKHLKTRLKMAHGNQTMVLEASLAELKRLKAENIGKTHERDRLYQILRLPLPPPVPLLPLVPLSFTQQNKQASIPINEEYKPIVSPPMDRFNPDVKAPVPRYPPPVPPFFQQYPQPASFFQSAMGYPPDQWKQKQWMGQQFLQSNYIQHQNFPDIQQPAGSVESAPPNLYSSPNTRVSEDTQILHDFLLGQL